MPDYTNHPDINPIDSEASQIAQRFQPISESSFQRIMGITPDGLRKKSAFIQLGEQVIPKKLYEIRQDVESNAKPTQNRPYDLYDQVDDIRECLMSIINNWDKCPNTPEIRKFKLLSSTIEGIKSLHER